MKITVLDSGFVTGDFLKPVAYAGEMNSRKLDIVHPHFKDCYYQILIKRYDGLYTLGIDDGVATLPPSLTRSATTLECQFVAMSTPDSVQNSETDTFVFESNSFKLTVAQGMDKGGLSPVPTYEELQHMYANIRNAKSEVEKAKADNERILIAIQEALAAAHKVPTIDIEVEVRNRFREQLDQIASEYYEEFTQDIVAEVLRRVTEQQAICCKACHPSTDEPSSPDSPTNISVDELQELVENILNDMLKELQTNTATWYSKRPTHSLSQSNSSIGG